MYGYSLYMKPEPDYARMWKPDDLPVYDASARLLYALGHTGLDRQAAAVLVFAAGKQAMKFTVTLADAYYVFAENLPTMRREEVATFNLRATRFTNALRRVNLDRQAGALVVLDAVDELCADPTLPDELTGRIADIGLAAARAAVLAS